jgi:tryptophanyl-tRNA synthetase
LRLVDGVEFGAFKIWSVCLRFVVVAMEEENGAVEGEASEQVVTPWNVESKDGGINYEKLIVEFGCSRMDADMVARVERLTGRPAHPFLRRSVFFAHREFDKILDSFEKGEKFYLYTGRGPSSEALHLGHLVPFMFTK